MVFSFLFHSLNILLSSSLQFSASASFQFSGKIPSWLWSSLELGSILSAVIEVLSEKLTTPEILGFFKSHKLNDGLLGKLKETQITFNRISDEEEEQEEEVEVEVVEEEEEEIEVVVVEEEEEEEEMSLSLVK
ncbi:hypothetical protein NC652_037425 [Populus alba x Populus x berolinensis]|uniref:Uncharacterized protein n=1 Tax=Populus alba x Populus x berolinensis TaxID=444605 RepID=A0AAD6LE44_9ROSI|nr:hypothetical protein NC652_037425 [Populus alba x Populus x berolinensis]KAJ6959018.1 hypothetical protein NC653_037336 [Populus alba x Populus x berolinensis]